MTAMDDRAATLGPSEPTPGSGLAVAARGLAKHYGSGDGVNGLDLHIPEGCKFGLIGPNGAGKSTTLKMLMGILAPDAGDLAVLGQSDPHRHPELRARIGYVPERHHIYRWMRVGEVIQFARAFYPTWNVALCEELRVQYGLAPDKKVEQLSHGMSTKLALILALSHEPELLILDEPTTGLDPLVREEFLDGVLHPLVAKTARTVLFSSHILSDIESVCDTVAILNKGRLRVCGPREALLDRTRRVTLTLDATAPRLQEPEDAIRARHDGERTTLTLGDFSADRAAELRALPGVQSLEVHGMSLEEIFKDYIRGAES